jgi:exopolysaccharide biosynthesis polyprenyl glycosylphosphotransferase
MSLDKARGAYRNILVIGADANAEKLVQFYGKNPRFSTRVIGYLDDSRSKDERLGGIPVLGRLSDLPALVKNMREIHEVVLSAPVPDAAMLKMIFECEKEMVTFRRVADLYGLIASRMTVSSLSGVSLLSFTDSPLVEWENRFLKRAMDILFSATGLVVLFPLFVVVALLVKKDSKGPVFYRQDRIGENGKKFMIYKFRTMRVDAEAATGPVWAKAEDPRRTKLGAALRKSNVDELPQLWNVLKGDMSLVGPRPERDVFVTQFREDIPRYMARHSIRSGMTGWAQVNGLRGNTSIEERTKFDLYYIENWSAWFDLKILAMTFLANRNAY